MGAAQFNVAVGYLLADKGVCWCANGGAVVCVVRKFDANLTVGDEDVDILPQDDIDDDDDDDDVDDDDDDEDEDNDNFVAVICK